MSINKPVKQNPRAASRPHSEGKSTSQSTSLSPARKRTQHIGNLPNDSKLRFKNLLESAPGAIVVINPAGHIDMVNARTEEMFGYRREELVNQPVEILLPERFRSVHNGHLTAYFENPGQRPMGAGRDLAGLHKDGSEFPVEIGLSYARDENSTLSIAFIADITERKRAEEAIRRADREIRMVGKCNQVLVRANDEASLLREVCDIIAADGGYRLVWVGLAETDTHKSIRPVVFAGAEVGYLSVLNLTWADPSEKFGVANMAVRTGKPVIIADTQTDPRFETKTEALQRGYLSCIALPLNADGHAFGALVIYAPETGAFGENEVSLLTQLADDLAYGVMALRTEARRQLAEQAMQVSEMRYRRLFESAKDGILILDAKTGQIVDVNPFLIDLLGYSHEEFLGKKIWQVGPFTNVFASKSAFTTLRKKGYIRYEDLPLETRYGRKVSVEFVSNIYQVDHKPVIQCNIRDITERVRADEELRKLLRAVEQSADSIFITDADGNIEYINPKFSELTGYSPEDMLGRNPRLLQSGETPPEVYEQLWKAITAGEEWRGELHNKKKNGDLFWVSASISAVRDSAGIITHFIAIQEDTTQHKQAHEALQKRAIQLALVNEIGKQIVATFDLGVLFDTAVTLIHERFDYQHVGLFTVDRKRKELVMKSRAGIYASKFPDEHRLKIGEGMVGWVALHGGLLLANDVNAEPRFTNPFPDRTIQAEVSVPIKMGEEIIAVLDVQSKERDVFDDSDLLVLETLAGQIAVAIQNAGLYHELEAYSEVLQQAVDERTADLEAIKDRLEAILDNCPDPIILLNRDCAVDKANPAFYQLFHTLEGNIRKHPLSDLVVSSQVGTIRDALDQLIATHQTQRLEVTARRADETTFEADVALAIISQGAQMIGAVCILRDITAFKEVERLKDEFVSNVSHELRTPITSMMLNQDLMVRNPAKLDIYLERLKRETKRLNDLIEDLLRLSRLDQGRAEMRLEVIDLNVLVSQYVDDRIPLAESKHLTLSSELNPGACLVKADKGLMGQVLSILLTNAFNYTPAGGQVVVQTHERNKSNGHEVGFSVKDSGPGISLDEQQRLFERFFRGRAGQSSGAAGTGLGLAIAKGVVDKHGGSITVASEGIPGEGSTFTVLLSAETQ